MELWTHEIATLRKDKPWLSDRQVRESVAGAVEYIREDTGVTLDANSPMTLQAAGFLFVQYVHESDAEIKRRLRANILALTDAYRLAG